MFWQFVQGWPSLRSAKQCWGRAHCSWDLRYAAGWSSVRFVDRPLRCGPAEILAVAPLAVLRWQLVPPHPKKERKVGRVLRRCLESLFRLVVGVLRTLTQAASRAARSAASPSMCSSWRSWRSLLFPSARPASTSPDGRLFLRGRRSHNPVVFFRGGLIVAGQRLPSALLAVTSQ